jgi:hypothetical protein
MQPSLPGTGMPPIKHHICRFPIWFSLFSTFQLVPSHIVLRVPKLLRIVMFQPLDVRDRYDVKPISGPAVAEGEPSLPSGKKVVHVHPRTHQVHLGHMGENHVDADIERWQPN